MSFEKTNLETALIVALQNGEEQAVANWYHDYSPRLHHYIARKVDIEADIEELVQEVFINCLKNIARFRGQSKVYTWMCSIANHEVADYYRKRYAKKFIHTLPLADYLFNDEVIINNAHETAELLDKVFKKIGQKTKELLLLKYIDKRRTAEIANIMGKTPKAIESELYRAREDFKSAYLHENEDLSD